MPAEPRRRGGPWPDLIGGVWGLAVEGLVVGVLLVLALALAAVVAWVW